ncbi:MAG TPA: hypothetical protein DCS05_05210 [Nitrospiraceae bacterium]|nr:hypothetical protein [Nitrospiraceae bacterium]
MNKKSSECPKCIFERETGFHLFVTDIYVDGNGHESEMRWIPKFQACRALSKASAQATPSGTIGDWFNPKQIRADWLPGVDYETVIMGGYWVDMWLNSAHDATRKSRGTVCDGSAPNQAYVSQRGVAPMVSQNIAHFRTHLASRFTGGGFAGSGGCKDWSGKGGLITDQHWFELWIWTRINGWQLHGNTNGYNAPGNVPSWHKDPAETGLLDESHPAGWGLSITGGGPRSWDIPVGDFCGNRWEFTDGLRLKDGVIYSAGKTINPWAKPDDGYQHKAFNNTNLKLTGVESGQSIASYRTEDSIKLHGIPASGVKAGEGGFDGGGIWYWKSGETSALRGGSVNNGPRCPGALDVSDGPWNFNNDVSARAVLVP